MYTQKKKKIKFPIHTFEVDDAMLSPWHYILTADSLPNHQNTMMGVAGYSRGTDHLGKTWLYTS